MVQHYFDRIYKRGAHRIRRRTREQPKYDIGENDDFIPVTNEEASPPYNDGRNEYI